MFAHLVFPAVLSGYQDSSHTLSSEIPPVLYSFLIIDLEPYREQISFLPVFHLHFLFLFSYLIIPIVTLTLSFKNWFFYCLILKELRGLE